LTNSYTCFEQPIDTELQISHELLEISMIVVFED